MKSNLKKRYQVETPNRIMYEMDNNLWIQFTCGHIVSPMPKVGAIIFSCENNTKISVRIVLLATLTVLAS